MIWSDNKTNSLKNETRFLKKITLHGLSRFARKRNVSTSRVAKNNCRERGITYACIHDWFVPHDKYVILEDHYEMEKPKEKEEIIMTGIKYLVGGYGIHKDRMNVVVKETPKYYKLNNGDRIRKDTMWTDKAISPFQDFNYSVREATQEEINKFMSEETK